MPPRAKIAATTFTMDSSASERMAVEPVIRYAWYLATRMRTPTTSEISPARRRVRVSAAASPGAITSPTITADDTPATARRLSRAIEDGREQDGQEHGARGAEDHQPGPGQRGD